MLSGIFLVGYAIARMIGEQFREPEVALPSDVTTWGQWLSVPMLLYGAYLIWTAKPVPLRKAPSVPPPGPQSGAKSQQPGNPSKP
jgi:phosphatidylglycerol:prolipoprotein diacylglycerol transferase